MAKTAKVSLFQFFLFRLNYFSQEGKAYVKRSGKKTTGGKGAGGAKKKSTK